MKATGKYWIPVYNILEDDCTIVLALPKYVKVIRGKKTDKKNAKWIADLFKQELAILQTAPGISSVFTAIGIISEIGTNMEAFPSAKHLCSWAGPTPTNNEKCLQLKLQGKSSQQLHNLNIINIQFLKQPLKNGLSVMRLRQWIPSASHFQPCPPLGLTIDIPSEVNLFLDNCPVSSSSNKASPVLSIAFHWLLGIPARVKACDVLVFKINVFPSLTIYSTGKSAALTFPELIAFTKSSIVLIGSPAKSEHIFLPSALKVLHTAGR